MIHKIENFSLKNRFIILVASISFGFFILGGWSYKTIEEIKINGPIYQEIITGKDLVADILPPPEYIVESYLTAMQMADTDSQNIEELKSKILTLKAEYINRHQYWLSKSFDGQIKKLITEDAYAPAQNFYELVEQVYFPAIASGDKNSIKYALSAIDKKYIQHRNIINEIIPRINLLNQKNEEIANAKLSEDKTWMLMVFFATLFLGVFLSAIISNGVIRQIGGEPTYARDMVINLSKGNLSNKIITKLGDDHSLIAALKTMQQELSSILQMLLDRSIDLDKSAQNLKESLETLLISDRSQTSSVSLIATAVEQMSSNIHQISDRAMMAYKCAENVNIQANESSTIIEQATHVMTNTAAEVSTTSKNIAEMESSAKDVSSIINVIRDVSDQTNLLALNAAIEAARAGDQGRGFAVVADEVRKLAERTRNSSQEIQVMVEKIQTITHESVDGMNKNIINVEKSKEFTQDASLGISNIRLAANDTIGAVNDINIALSEQQKASDEINRNISTIVATMGNSSSAMEDTSILAKNLDSHAGELKLIVQRFKLR